MKEGWNTSELKDICSKYGEYGMSVPSKPFDGIRYLRITDITDNGSLNPELVSAEIENIDDSYRLEIGDVLFARTGATVGKTLVYEESMGPCVYAGYLIRYKPDQSIILPRFLYYITHSNKYYQWVNKNQKVAAQPNISAKLYNSYKVSYPSLHEQQQIVDFLDAEFAKIDELKNQAEQSLQNAKDLFQAALKEMLTPKDGWKEENLISEFKLKSGDYLPTKSQKSGKIPVYGGNGIAGYHDSSNLTGKNLLIGRVGALCGNVHLAIGPVWVTDNAFIVSGVSDSWNIDFLGKQLAYLNLNQYASQTAQPVISNKSMKDVSVFMPPLEEQISIAEKLNNFEEKQQQLQSNYTRTIQLCADLKQALLRQVFE